MMPQGVIDKGIICFKCTLRIIESGEIVAEGRASAQFGEKSSWNINTCIKICKKRAQTDAVLSLGFSDFFTQDMEGDETGNTKYQPPHPIPKKAAAPQEPPAAPKMASAQQIKKIRALMAEQFIDEAKVKESAQIKSFKELPGAWASKLIEKLEAKTIDPSLRKDDAPPPYDPDDEHPFKEDN
jgi:hypothetical protein